VETISEPWSAERVRALAPDASSVKAGEGLARPAKWSGTGCSERAVWGLCQGSGLRQTSERAPYQTTVELAGPSYRCSCPSRKFPCKHALGLLLIWSAGSLAAASEPDWVSDWLAVRASRAERPAGGRRAGGAVADPDAARQRAERRAERVAGGVAELNAWLTDRVRRGFAGFEQQGWTELSLLAARMVDAQAPGLAGSLRRAAGTVGRGHGWPSQLLEELALIQLVASAHDRLADLPPALAETVRSRIGWTVETARVLAEGERVTDDWLILGRVVELDERLTTRRLWLRGRTSGRTALLLSFAPAGQTLDPLPGLPGRTITATLAFYPGAGALRALLTDADEPTSSSAPAVTADSPESASAAVHGEAGGAAGRPDGMSVAAALASYAEGLAADPWLERIPVLLADVRPARHGDGWAAVDPQGDGLPLIAYADPWPLISVSAGAPVTVAAEWSRGGLRPMTCWDGDRVVALS